MILAILVFLLGSAGETDHCTSAEPFPPRASMALEEALSNAATKKGAERREIIQNALLKAREHGDHVGEAEAYFSLAKLEFEETRKWPVENLENAAAVCKKSGCGPELMEALFRWAEALGHGDPLASQAVEQAFSIAESEAQRPLAAVRELSERDAILVDELKLPNLSSRGVTLAISILNKQAADANAKHDFAREANAEGALARIYLSRGDHQQASNEFSKATATLAAGTCGPESIFMLMEWAGTFPKPGGDPEFDGVLNRAISVAENETKDPEQAVNNLAHFYSWDAAPLATRKRYLAARLASMQKAGAPQSWQLSFLAADAKQLGDLNLAAKLYKQLLAASPESREAVGYLNALAEIAEQQGKKDLAGQYRQRATVLAKKHGGSITTGGFGSTTVATSGGGGTSKPPKSPWDPPEMPGSEGATPGAHPKDPPPPN